MVALSTLSTRHSSERPTHPVDPSTAPSKPRTRRIRSSARGASYDRIIRPLKRPPKDEAKPSTRSTVISSQSERSTSSFTSGRSRASLFSAYRVTTHLQIGMTVSLSS